MILISGLKVASLNVLCHRSGMSEDMSVQQVIEIATQVAGRELGAAGVQSVDVRADLDADGDKIWRIMVILADPRRAEAGRLAGFTRHLRERLAPDAPFPVVSFRSAPDERSVNPEAA